MFIFRCRRKEALTQRLIEAERAATADLVEKHAEEMLNLINEKREELVKASCQLDSYKYQLNYAIIV